MALNDLKFEKEFHIEIRLGKGSKDRFVGLGEFCYCALMKYLVIREKAAVDELFPSSDILFPSLSSGKALSRHTAYRIFRNICQDAGIERSVSPHILRHTAAKTLIKRGCDALTLQRLLGHEKASTTSIYFNLVPEELARRHRQFSPVDGVIKGTV